MNICIRAPLSASPLRERRRVRVVLVGDRGCGRSSLVASLLHERFHAKVPAVLKAVSAGPDQTGHNLSLDIVDTSSSISERKATIKQMCSADVILIVCSFDNERSLLQCEELWFPLMTQLELDTPVVVAVNKSDLRHSTANNSLFAERARRIGNHPRVYSMVECSAKSLAFVPQLFISVQEAFFFPRSPLVDIVTGEPTAEFLQALNRVFRLLDCDHDDVLNDDELSSFQERCSGQRLGAEQIQAVKQLVASQCNESAEGGVTFTMFCQLMDILLQTRQIDSVWDILTQFGYGANLLLRDDYVSYPSALGDRAFDQSCELTPRAVGFLTRLFRQFDRDHDGGLSNAITLQQQQQQHMQLDLDKSDSNNSNNNSNNNNSDINKAKQQHGASSELEALFACSPVIPMAPNYSEFLHTNVFDNLSLDGFLSQWANMCLWAPETTLMHLCYLGFDAEHLRDAVVVNPSKRKEANKDSIKRQSVYALVYGAHGAGKTSLMRALVGKSFEPELPSTDTPAMYANIVRTSGDDEQQQQQQERDDNADDESDDNDNDHDRRRRASQQQQQQQQKLQRNEESKAMSQADIESAEQDARIQAALERTIGKDALQQHDNNSNSNNNNNNNNNNDNAEEATAAAELEFDRAAHANATTTRTAKDESAEAEAAAQARRRSVRGRKQQQRSQAQWETREANKLMAGRKFLVMMEVPDNEELVDESLKPHGEAERCDLICLVYQAGNQQSFEYIDRLLPLLPEHVPCVVIQTHADEFVDPPPSPESNTAQYEVPLEAVATKFMDTHDMSFFERLVQAALNPGVARPHSPEKKRRQQMVTWATTAGGVAVVALGALYLLKSMLSSSSSSKK